MTRKIWNAKLLHLILGFTFLNGLLPISNHMLSMQAMYMDSVTSISSPVQEKTSNNTTGSCCEAIGSFLLACDFMLFHPAYVSSNRGSDQIAYSVPLVRSISIKNLTPPPK